MCAFLFFAEPEYQLFSVKPGEAEGGMDWSRAQRLNSRCSAAALEPFKQIRLVYLKRKRPEYFPFASLITETPAQVETWKRPTPQFQVSIRCHFRAGSEEVCLLVCLVAHTLWGNASLITGSINLKIIHRNLFLKSYLVMSIIWKFSSFIYFYLYNIFISCSFCTVFAAVIMQMSPMWV